MRKLRVNGTGILVLLINMLLHWEGSIPAWILLILHYAIGLSVKWFWIALLLLSMLLWGGIYGWAAKCGNTPDPPKKNVNPYSVGQDENRK